MPGPVVHVLESRTVTSQGDALRELDRVRVSSVDDSVDGCACAPWVRRGRPTMCLV
jgi:hypothetical protein